MHADFTNKEPDPIRDISSAQAMVYIWKQLWQHPLSLSIVLLFSIGVALSEGLSVGLILPILESIKGEDSSSLLSNTPVGALTPLFDGLSTVAKIRTIAIALFVIQSTKSAMEYFNIRLSYRLQIKVERGFRLGVFEELLGAGLGFIQNEKQANLFTILNNYTGNSGAIARAVVGTVPLFTTLLLYTFLLLSISWQLTALAIGLALTTTLMMGSITKRLRIRGSKFNQAAVQLNHDGFESLNAMRLLRLFAREDFSRNRFTQSVDQWQHQSYALGTLRALIAPLYAASSVMVLALLLLAATVVLQHGETAWVELAMIFVLVLFRLMGPSSALNNSRAIIAGNMHALQSLITFLQREDKGSLPEGNVQFKGLQDGIHLNRVSFRYSATEPEVLKDLTLTIPKGQMTAIVGGSGSGKSTLMSLLARLYDPTDGNIIVDGMDLKEYKSNTWRRRIGVVSQDTFLFNDTLGSNIQFGKLDANDREIEAASRKANAHDFTLEMPDGYETILGDRGIRLSGGQAQRVAIARAILVDPEVLMLDEATSSLDTEAEQLVQEAIDRVAGQRTVVVVAHRLSTIRDADNIIVLEHGELVEQGRHEELIAKRGRYWHYVQLQNLTPGQIDVDPENNRTVGTSKS